MFELQSSTPASLAAQVRDCLHCTRASKGMYSSLSISPAVSVQEEQLQQAQTNTQVQESLLQLSTWQQVAGAVDQHGPQLSHVTLGLLIARLGALALHGSTAEAAQGGAPPSHPSTTAGQRASGWPHAEQPAQWQWEGPSLSMQADARWQALLVNLTLMVAHKITWFTAPQFAQVTRQGFGLRQVTWLGAQGSDVPACCHFKGAEPGGDRCTVDAICHLPHAMQVSLGLAQCGHSSPPFWAGFSAAAERRLLSFNGRNLAQLLTGLGRCMGRGTIICAIELSC